MRREWKTVSRQIPEVEELTGDRLRRGERERGLRRRRRDEKELLSTLSPK